MRLRWIVLILSFLILFFIGVSLYARVLAMRLLRQQRALVHFYADALRYAAQAPEECLRDFLWSYLFPDKQAVSQLFIVPLVLTSEKGKVISHNLHELEKKLPTSSTLEDYLPFLHADTLAFPPVVVRFAEGRYLKIYYGEPLILRQLRWMPIVSSGLVFLAGIIGLFFLYTAYRYRQDKLWVGLARETAHQLGTPLSGLVGAVEILKDSPHLLPQMLPLMESDLKRLTEISDRFSKIGSAPFLTPQPILPLVQEVVAYFQAKVPSTVELQVLAPPEVNPSLPINKILIKWVIENLIRNSLDALPPEGGKVIVRLTMRRHELWIDVEDTGKGIPASQWEVVFRPGFSTKSRGWGIGLSLSRRIIEEYHKGEIFVHRSEIGKGTVIRIRLPLRRRLLLLPKVWRSIYVRLNRLLRTS
ncbi:MAG: HAMP domain-containing sensor histidine kinase [Bacteroidia bacterium]|nr:HAMP domain-containing histidine kinase [Bacteroidia bacterium]MDW8133767.1 HAMP domain-containing sensor histidine kinase [Bacteroidia bacterium]